MVGFSGRKVAEIINVEKMVKWFFRTLQSPDATVFDAVFVISQEARLHLAQKRLENPARLQIQPHPPKILSVI